MNVVLKWMYFYVGSGLRNLNSYYYWWSVSFFWLLCRHTASAPTTAGTHTVVCSNKVAWKRLARRHSRNAPHPGQQLIFYFDVFVEFVISLFISCIKMNIISCIHLFYLPGSDFIYSCLTNLILVGRPRTVSSVQFNLIYFEFRFHVYFFIHFQFICHYLYLFQRFMPFFMIFFIILMSIFLINFQFVCHFFGSIPNFWSKFLIHFNFYAHFYQQFQIFLSYLEQIQVSCTFFLKFLKAKSEIFSLFAFYFIC